MKYNYKKDIKMSGHTVQTIAIDHLLLSNANCYIIFEWIDK